MSDEPKTPEVTQEPPASAQPSAETKKTEQEHMIPKSRFDEINEAKNKAEQELATYRKAEEDRKNAELTEAERLKKERDEAKSEAETLKTKQAQRDAAEKVGLPAVFADRIKGATPEDMEADAKTLLEAMPKGTQRKPPPPPSSPAEGLPQTQTDDERRKFLFGRQS